MTHMIPVSYKWANTVNKLEECYQLWRKGVPHLSAQTCTNIDDEWRADTLRLMVPQEEWEKLINS